MKSRLDKNNIIGKAWQYTVYDLGNGRVHKKFHSYKESFEIIRRDWWFAFWMASNLAKEMRTNAIKSLDFLDKFLNQNPEYEFLFGNFKRISEFDIEQDKVIPLKVYFENHSIEENKIVIDKFVELNRLFFKHGFMDKALKVGENFGINEAGQVILMDIGEIWFDKNNVRQQVEKRVWRSRYWTRCIPCGLKKYYLREMDKVFLSGSKNV